MPGSHSKKDKLKKRISKIGMAKRKPTLKDLERELEGTGKQRSELPKDVSI